MKDLLTFSGQILILFGAILGAGGGFRYFVEPVLKRRHLRRVMGTGVWLSCYELRHHLKEITKKLTESKSADETREALRKIPSADFKDHPDWFLKTGYFSMITAYRIAAFSSWMRIYQMAVLRQLFTETLGSELFQKFDAFKISASENTYLWYSYIDAIGEKLVFML
jgi:hypothetical protein